MTFVSNKVLLNMAKHTNALIQKKILRVSAQLVFRILLDNAREAAGIQLLSRFCDKGAFTNYVDKFLSFFNHLPHSFTFTKTNSL